MKGVYGRYFFEGPPEVGLEEGDSPRDCGQLVVIHEHDSSRTDEAPQIDEIEEHSVESMVAVDEPEVEAPTFVQESRKRDLRSLGMVLYDLRDPRFLEELQAAARVARRLKRIEGNVPNGVVTVLDQPSQMNSAEMP